MKTLTTKDVAVIKFIEDTKLYMTAKQVARMFYKNKNNTEKSALLSAQRRLRVMIDHLQLKRIRSSVSDEYIYYSAKNPPRVVKHKLTISEFISTMNLLPGIEIVEVKTEWNELSETYSVRSDIKIDFIYNNKKYVALVEVDLTKDFTNSKKYSDLLAARKYDSNVKSMLPERKTFIISVCDRQPPTNDLRIIWVKTNMEFIDQLLYRLN